MDIIEWGIRTLDNIVKHGLNLKIIFLSIITLYNVSLVRKMLHRRLPKRFRHEDRLETIERDVRAIKEHMGVTECRADLKHGKKDASVTDGRKKNSTSSRVGYVLADFIKSFTRVTEIFHLRGKRTMKSKWLSRKFILAVAGCAVIILNDILELNVDKDAVFTFAGILATWIATEGVVDANRKTPEVSDAYTTPKDAGNVQDTAN